MSWNTDLKYGVGLSFEHPMVKSGYTDFAINTDWTPAAGDVKVSIDSGALANITTLPVYLGSGLWTFTLSAAEMSGSRIAIVIIDAATKAVEDQAIILTTTRWNNNLATGTFVAAGSTTSTFVTNSTFVVDAFKGSFLRATSGSAVGQTVKIGSNTITDVVAATGETFTAIPANGDTFEIF